MSPTAIFAALTGPPGINVPGAFPLLQLRHPVTGGEPFDLYLTIQDRTDAYADSAVALDNFHWLSPQAVTPPATAQSAPAAPGPTGAGAAAPLEIAPDCSGAKGYSGDRDNDGLPDGWEEHGVYGFGPKAPDDAPAPLEHMDLKAWGAHPDVKDIFVELDAMRPLTPDGYEPLLAPNTIGWVVAAFARAPVDPLPDSTIAAPAYRGIRLHVDYGPSAPLIWAAPVGGSPPPWGDEGRGGHLSVPPLPVLCTGEQCVKDLDGLWSTLDVIRQAEFSPARARVFHYALSAHELAPCSGAMMQISERDCGLDPQISGISRNVGEVEQGASDFVVSLGNAIWEPDTSISETVAIRQAGTFMHELGHNLGLSHYGVPTQAAEFDPPPGDQVDPVRWYLQQAARHMNKPNHLSVMNYLYQTEGLVAVEPSFRLDYARYNMAPLDEAALDEAEGIRLVASGIVLSYTLGVRHYCQSDVISVTVDARTVDWNCGETIDPSAVTHTINADRYEEDEAAVLSVLTSTNEWERLVFTGGALNRQRSLLPPLLAVRAPLPAAASLPCDSPPTP
jgi:hypothetical protein